MSISPRHQQKFLPSKIKGEEQREKEEKEGNFLCINPKKPYNDQYERDLQFIKKGKSEKGLSVYK
jgi:hypothetical protein